MGNSGLSAIAYVHIHLHFMYRISGKFGEDFNLAVWRIVKNRQIKFSPIIKRDVIRNTHAHGLSTLQCARYVQASLRKDC